MSSVNLFLKRFTKKNKLQNELVKPFGLCYNRAEKSISSMEGSG